MRWDRWGQVASIAINVRTRSWSMHQVRGRRYAPSVGERKGSLVSAGNEHPIDSAAESLLHRLSEQTEDVIDDACAELWPDGDEDWWNLPPLNAPELPRYSFSEHVYGSGDGSGSGSGYGSGYGYGYGSGSDDGYGSLVATAFADQVPPDTTVAIWRSDQDGYSANGGTKTQPARPGLVQEVQGPLEACSSRALHGSLNPAQWKGDRWWIVALHEPVVRQDDKIASLKRTIICELL